MLLILFSATPALAAQCGKGEEPTPYGGCIRTCPLGDYHIEKQNGHNTCVRDGNATVTAHTKYAFVSLTAHNTTDNSCFGIRPDETAVDDRFVYKEWHAPNSQIWVTEISYTLDPALTRCTSRQRNTPPLTRTETLPGSAALRSPRMLW